MIIYNVTIKIDLNVHDTWLNWMRGEHIPRVMETGCFTGYKMFRILEENTQDGISYCIQYAANEIADYFNYKANFAEGLQKESLEAFPGKFLAFRTLLREV
jgi:hypothetical protein